LGGTRGMRGMRESKKAVVREAPPEAKEKTQGRGHKVADIQSKKKGGQKVRRGP